MHNFLEFSIFNKIFDLFRRVGGFLSFDLILYIFVGLEIVAILYFVIKTHYSYELRALRTLDKINLYLLANPYIKEENLIEFNKIMKRIPQTIRYHWQQYMLNRDTSPSKYLTSNNIIEKPLKSSSLSTNLKTAWFLTGLFAMTSAFLSLFVKLAEGATQTIANIFCYSIIVPFIVLVLGSVTVALQRLRKDVGIRELYNVFHIFQNLLDKACSTIPQYVDFEVLFTQKEIAKGIPVLNEYLEKRDRQIQEEMEKARLNAVEHESFDFENVDINGTLILERAMKECEVFINLRTRVYNEIQQIDTEIDSLKKSYDNQQREYQRKIQASKENVSRLRQQQEATTNRIDSNYIRKQITDEVNKQQQLEKDNDDQTVKFKQELKTLEGEIEKRNQELSGQKDYLENAMLSEYETYSGKVYKGLKELVEKRDAEARRAMAQRQEQSNKEISNLNGRVENLKSENETLREKISKLGKELTEKDLFYTNALLNTASAKKVKIDMSGKPVGEYQLEQQQIQMSDADSKYDEYGGFYDEEGYYRYKNGTYYDPQGNYFDEYGGHYDTQGNYYPPNGENQVVDDNESDSDKQLKMAEMTQDEQVFENETDGQNLVGNKQQAEQDEKLVDNVSFAEDVIEQKPSNNQTTNNQKEDKDNSKDSVADDSQDFSKKNENRSFNDRLHDDGLQGNGYSKYESVANDERFVDDNEIRSARINEGYMENQSQTNSNRSTYVQNLGNMQNAGYKQNMAEQDYNKNTFYEKNQNYGQNFAQNTGYGQYSGYGQEYQNRQNYVSNAGYVQNLNEQSYGQNLNTKNAFEGGGNGGMTGQNYAISNQMGVAQPKGKPGRPRKYPIEDLTNKPKGKPGRPRKYPIEDLTNKPKGRPGRPPKNKMPDDLEFVELQNQINAENAKLQQSRNSLVESLNSINSDNN